MLTTGYLGNIPTYNARSSRKHEDMVLEDRIRKSGLEEFARTARTKGMIFLMRAVRAKVCAGIWADPRTAGTRPDLLSERERHGLFPTPLRLQDEFYYLARCAPPGKSASRKVADRGQLGSAIGYANCQSSSTRKRNVRQIVAHVGDLFFGHACFLDALLESLRLLRLSQIYKRDSQFFCAPGDGR